MIKKNNVGVLVFSPSLRRMDVMVRGVTLMDLLTELSGLVD